MDYETPSALTDLGIPSMPDKGPKSVLELMKNISPPVQEYEIQKGDTLSQIAKRFGTTVKEIARLNPEIKDVNKIRAGATIDIPGKELPQEQGYTPMNLLSGLINPPSPANQNDAIESVAPEAYLGGPASAAGAGVLGAMMPKAIQGMARMAPRAMPQAGRAMLPQGMPNVMMPGGLQRGMGSAGNTGMSKIEAMNAMRQRMNPGPQMPGPNTVAGGMPPSGPGMQLPQLGQPGGQLPNPQMLIQMLQAAGVR